jgi:phenylacetate-coenzyme A ligase PaaK-like adenylate-forming protein
MVSAFSLSLHRQRYMGRFHKFRDLLDRIQGRTPAEIGAWQDERLAELVRHAYHTVPFYRRIFEDRKLTPISDVPFVLS